VRQTLARELEREASLDEVAAAAALSPAQAEEALSLPAGFVPLGSANPDHYGSTTETSTRRQAKRTSASTAASPAPVSTSCSTHCPSSNVK
jgi:hypothetical protein